MERQLRAHQRVPLPVPLVLKADQMLFDQKQARCFPTVKIQTGRKLVCRNQIARQDLRAGQKQSQSLEKKFGQMQTLVQRGTTARGQKVRQRPMIVPLAERVDRRQAVRTLRAGKVEQKHSRVAQGLPVGQMLTLEILD